MTQRYAFIGSYTEMGDRLFSRVGQTADWDEEFYASMVQGLSFIPDYEFDRLEISQDELGKYADYANRGIAPESFNDKVRAGALVLADIRARLASRGVHEELETQTDPTDQPVEMEMEIQGNTEQDEPVETEILGERENKPSRELEENTMSIGENHV